MGNILAIDQGTTSSRAIVFDQAMTPISDAQEEFEQHFPRSGWVEHTPQDLWDTTMRPCRAALSNADLNARDIAGKAWVYATPRRPSDVLRTITRRSSPTRLESRAFATVGISERYCLRRGP